VTITPPAKKGVIMTLELKDAADAPLSLGDLEDRSAPRIVLSLPAKLRASNMSAFNIVIKNLSLSGFACEAITSMPPGARCWLTMPGMESMQAEVIRNDGFIVGCAFQNLLNQAVLDALIARYTEPTAYNI